MYFFHCIRLRFIELSMCHDSHFINTIVLPLTFPTQFRQFMHFDEDDVYVVWPNYITCIGFPIGAILEWFRVHEGLRGNSREEVSPCRR